MNEIYQTKLGIDRYVKFDPSISRTRIRRPHQPCAYCAMVYCLKHGDKQAAEVIRERMNSEDDASQECHHPISRMDDGICLDCGEDFNL